MNYSAIDILDLPDEILLIIFSKLKFIDIFNSLVGINERLDQIVCDTILTQSIDLVATSSRDNKDVIVHRFCPKIFSRIHQNVRCLTLEPTLMECILRAHDYPHLYKLNFVQLDRQQILEYFNDNSPLIPIFQERISHLIVTVIENTETTSLEDLATDVFGRIFTLFTRLTHLEFGIYYTPQHPSLSLEHLPSNICLSSSIVYLCIRVLFFNDCLCLLDGRLEQLKTLIVHIDCFLFSVSNTIISTNSLHNLKCFSLMSRCGIRTYDTEIVPLLRRMSQLEELTLSLNVYNRKTYIEGSHLNKAIFSQMPYLRKLIFDIVTCITIIEEVPKSIDHIRRTFTQHVNGYIDYLPHNQGRCHIYSLPITMRSLHSISNRFPGNLFTTVRILTISDSMRPFEHEFFQRISHSFPIVNSLTVSNSLPQNEKRTRDSNDNENRLSIVEFSHLSKVNLSYAHVDYAEQLLVNTNTHLPSLDELEINYEHLMTATEHFTSEATRVVCATLQHLCFREEIVHSKDFYFYFPRV